MQDVAIKSTPLGSRNSNHSDDENFEDNTQVTVETWLMLEFCDMGSLQARLAALAALSSSPQSYLRMRMWQKISSPSKVVWENPGARPFLKGHQVQDGFGFLLSQSLNTACSTASVKRTIQACAMIWRRSMIIRPRLSEGGHRPRGLCEGRPRRAGAQFGRDPADGGARGDCDGLPARPQPPAWRPHWGQRAAAVQRQRGAVAPGDRPPVPHCQGD